MVTAPTRKFVGGYGGAVAELDRGMDGLTVEGVGYPADSGRSHCRVCHEHLFDFCGSDVDSPADDQILLPVDDEDIAVPVDSRQISCAEPTFVMGLPIRVGVADVSGA